MNVLAVGCLHQGDVICLLALTCVALANRADRRRAMMAMRLLEDLK